MNEEQIIKDLAYKSNYSQTGMKKYLKQHYPDVNYRSYSRIIKAARQKATKFEIDVIPPIDLDDNEMSLWVDLWSRIEKSNIEAVDHLAIATYCQVKAQYFDYVDLCKELPDNGVLQSDKGGRYPHPLIGMRNTAMKDAAKLESELGLTPAGRKKTGWKKKEDAKQSAMMALLNPVKKKSQ